MGKVARFACIFTPAALSTISAVILLVILLGGVSPNNTSLDNLYEYKIDFTDFKKSIASAQYMKPGSSLIDNLLYALRTSAQNGKLKDIYKVYLWNYCSGNGNKLDFCSARKAGYYFNPVTEWQLDSTLNDRHTPNGMALPMHAFEKSVQWMFAAYMIAFFANMVVILVTALAICSRIGSVIATIVASIATLFSFMGALTSTILFAALVKSWSSALEKYTIHVSRGSTMLSLDWIAFLCSAGAMVFWLFSSCCVSGKSSSRSNKSKNKGTSLRELTMAGSGYKQLNDQEKSLIADSEQQNRGVEMQDSAYTGGYSTGYTDESGLAAANQAHTSPYGGRESRYEPYRSVDA